MRESGSTIRVFRNFKEATAFKVPFPVVKIFGGRLIGVQAADFVCFYDWDTATLVRRIDVEARDLQWSEGGESLVVLCDASFFVLQYNPAALEQALADGAEINNEDGLGDAFEVVQEVEERVHTGMWVGACFVYLNATWRLNYAVGGETTTIVHLEKPMHLLGYHAQQQRLYLIDRDYAVVTYSLALAGEGLGVVGGGGDECWVGGVERGNGWVAAVSMLFSHHPRSDCVQCTDAPYQYIGVHILLSLLFHRPQ